MRHKEKRQILDKAIDKAIHNGWKKFPKTAKLKDWGWGYESEFWASYTTVSGSGAYENQDINSTYDLIFSHDFAKALWGEEEYPSIRDIHGPTYPNWHWHLQQMVIAKDPFKYLGESI